MAALMLLSGAAASALVSPQPFGIMTEDDVLLVIAPHPDDEVISSIGLMLEAKRAGAEVHVLYITNGEYPLTSMMANKDRASDDGNPYIALGYARQKESLAVMDPLGADSVTFLGYPDSLLIKMAGPKHWADEGARSPRTMRTDVPFENSPSFGKQSTGSNLLDDLITTIMAKKPSIIILPETDDAHADHSATGVLARIAVRCSSVRSGGSYQPRLLSYLVHVRDIAWNTGYHADRQKLPLPWMEGSGRKWLSLPVSNGDASTKRASIMTFSTQGAILNNTLLSFIRSNEIFCERDLDAHAGSSGIIEAALPSAETFERRAHPAADITGFSAEMGEAGICFTAELGGESSGRYTYVLRAYYADEEQVIVNALEVKVRGDLLKISATSSEGAPQLEGVQAEAVGNSLRIGIPRPSRGMKSIWIMMYSTYTIGDAILDCTPLVKLEDIARQI